MAQVGRHQNVVVHLLPINDDGQTPKSGCLITVVWARLHIVCPARLLDVPLRQLSLFDIKESTFPIFVKGRDINSEGEIAVRCSLAEIVPAM